MSGRTIRIHAVLGCEHAGPRPNELEREFLAREYATRLGSMESFPLERSNHKRDLP